MKILLTAHFAEEYRGVELFNWTLAKELSKTHDVSFFTFVPGKASQKISNYARIITKLDQDEKFDWLICSHNSCYKKVSHLCKTKLFVSHGLLSSLDDLPGDPSALTLGVSEEVFNSRKALGVIRNPIDMERFSPSDEWGRGILYLSAEQQPRILDKIERLGIPVERCSGEWNVEDYINKSEIVVSGARGALEAMACKKPAIVLGPYGYDGYCGEYWELKKHNFGGRRYKKDLTLDSLRYEIGKINDKDIRACYDYVKENHEVSKVVSRLEKLL
jgi:hypothetical protein